VAHELVFSDLNVAGLAFFSASACSVIRRILNKQTKFGSFFWGAPDRNVLFGKDNSIFFFRAHFYGEQQRASACLF
jgi:hypothetical protein